MNKSQLLEELSKQFPRSGAPEITEVLMDPDCRLSECETAITIFGGKRWDQIPPDALLYNEDSIHRLSHRAFLYYLPAFLHALIEGYHELDATADSIIGMMTPPTSHGQLRTGWKNSWYAKLDDGSKSLIQSVLIYLREQHHSFPSQQALDLFWHNPL